MNWTLGPCARRSIRLETIESPDASDEDLARLYDFWEAAGRRLGAYRAVTSFLKTSSARWNSNRSISVLVLRCGRGGLAFALSDWFRRHRVESRIVAVDRYARAVGMARDRRAAREEITFDTRDWRDPIYLQAAQFDYVVSSGALHAETSEGAADFLKVANRLARRGFVVEDGLRDWRAYTAYRWMGRTAGGDTVAQQAGVAVQRGFTLSEAAAIAKSAGLDYADVRARFWHRFTISSERGLDLAPRLRPVPGLAGA